MLLMLMLVGVVDVDWRWMIIVVDVDDVVVDDFLSFHDYVVNYFYGCYYCCMCD